jgi:hypothetical protein
MRIASALFVGSIAALLTAPVLAKNSEAQKMEEDKSAPPCHASVPAINGPGTQLPCEEVGSQAPEPRKPSAPSAEAHH